MENEAMKIFDFSEFFQKNPQNFSLNCGILSEKIFLHEIQNFWRWIQFSKEVS